MVARVVAQQASRGRTFRAVLQGCRATGRSFARVLHQLWLEVTGFVFLVLAAIGGLAGFREYARFQAGAPVLGRVFLALGFVLTFGYFGVSSFWRVRKKSGN